MKLKIKTIKQSNQLGFPKTNLGFIDQEPKCALCSKTLTYENFCWFSSEKNKFYCGECECTKNIIGNRLPILLKPLDTTS